MAHISLSQINKRFGSLEIIPDLSLEIEDGSFVALLGPSGSGKSTLLRMIAGLEHVTQGTITIGERDVTYVEPSKRGIAMVFQSYALYPHMSVYENIGYGLRIARMPKAQARKKIEQAAEILELTPYLKRKPSALSGGQRQRVAIGRAIVREPDVFLFDEPLSNLDAALRSQMRVELADIHERLGTTMVYVTHDQVEAMTMADKVVVLNAGHIDQVGAPMELYERPMTTFVAQFIGSPKMNLFEGEIAQKMGAHTIGVRPEHFELTGEGEAWHVNASHVERLGAETIVRAQNPELGAIDIRLNGSPGFEKGDEFAIYHAPQNIHRFDERGQRIVD